MFSGFAQKFRETSFNGAEEIIHAAGAMQRTANVISKVYFEKFIINGTQSFVISACYSIGCIEVLCILLHCYPR